MSKEIKSKVIGRLIQDEDSPDWWVSDEVETPFFDNEEMIAESLVGRTLGVNDGIM